MLDYKSMRSLTLFFLRCLEHDISTGRTSAASGRADTLREVINRLENSPTEGLPTFIFIDRTGNVEERDYHDDDLSRLLVRLSFEASQLGWSDKEAEIHVATDSEGSLGKFVAITRVPIKE